VFPVGAYLAAQNCREGQFRESLVPFYSRPEVMAVTKKREASRGLRMTAMRPEDAGPKLTPAPLSSKRSI
jgi:hypothetical protein